MESGKGGPFGCVIVKDGKIMGEGYNLVMYDKDPTAHGEVVAIRNTCKNLGTFNLTGCDVYTSCQPCPMCFWAIVWSGAARIFYSNSNKDAADYGFMENFSDEEMEFPYKERKDMEFYHYPLDSALQVFKDWSNRLGKE